METNIISALKNIFKLLADSPQLQQHAFFRNPKTKVMQDAGTPLGWNRSEAYDLNSKGQIAGGTRTLRFVAPRHLE